MSQTCLEVAIKDSKSQGSLKYRTLARVNTI